MLRRLKCWLGFHSYSDVFDDGKGNYIDPWESDYCQHCGKQ